MVKSQYPWFGSIFVVCFCPRFFEFLSIKAALWFFHLSLTPGILLFPGSLLLPHLWYFPTNQVIVLTSCIFEAGFAPARLPSTELSVGTWLSSLNLFISSARANILFTHTCSCHYKLYTTFLEFLELYVTILSCTFLLDFNCPWWIWCRHFVARDVLVDTKCLGCAVTLCPATIMSGSTAAKYVVRLWARLMSLWQDSNFEQLHN